MRGHRFVGSFRFQSAPPGHSERPDATSPLPATGQLSLIATIAIRDIEAQLAAADKASTQLTDAINNAHYDKAAAHLESTKRSLFAARRCLLDAHTALAVRATRAADAIDQSPHTTAADERALDEELEQAITLLDDRQAHIDNRLTALGQRY